MKTSLQKWGNSVGVRLPQQVVRNMHISVGSSLEIHEIPKGLLLTKSAQVDLASLVANITPLNSHSEYDWGSSRGNEVW